MERTYLITTARDDADSIHEASYAAMKESKKVAAGIAQYVDAKKLLEDCTMDSTTL